MCALQIRCPTKEGVVKHLRTCLEEKSDQLKKYKEGVKPLSQEVKALTEQVKKLEGSTHRAKELMDANAILTAEVTSLRESLNWAKADAVEEYKDLQPFFNLLGFQYDEGFEDFRKQVVAFFPNMNFSSIQIKLTVPPILKPNDEVVKVDVEGDTPENTVTPQVVEGGGQPQVEEATINVDNANPVAQKKFVVFVFLSFLEIVSLI